MRPPAAMQLGATSAYKAADGTIEALKWLAMALMTLDHVNKYLFAHALPGAFELGRLAMPLFVFVLAYNLARPGAIESGTYIRIMKRLAIYGLVATPFFMGLGGLIAGWLPLNIMFMLLLATATLYQARTGGKEGLFFAGLLFVFGGIFVEFWWFALAFFLASWLYCTTTSKAALGLMVLAAASLYVVNSNLWAVMSIPLILAAPLVSINVPRYRHVFYAYYPAHLAAILLISKILGISVGAKG